MSEGEHYFILKPDWKPLHWGKEGELAPEVLVDKIKNSQKRARSRHFHQLSNDTFFGVHLP